MTVRSRAMSPSGVLMIRVVKFGPAPEKVPVVVPAPKISSLAAVVLIVPLLAAVPVPAAAAETSSGLAGSRPLYSSARTSTYGVAVLNDVVTVLVPAAAALMFDA